MSLETILLWLAIGLISGWLASAVVGGGMGVIGDIVVGIVGAFIGGVLFQQMGWSAPIGGLAGTILIAFIGAVILLLLLRLIPARQRARLSEESKGVAKAHHLILTPGMFGFGRLASFDYFAHLQLGLARRFADAGVEVLMHVADVPPTASVRRRTVALTEFVASQDRGGPIHLLGHSTGGLDARLAASPSITLTVGKDGLGWLPRLRTVITMNTPHFGTPLANFFATANGQRVLYALSAMTVVGLSLGSPPIALASALISVLGRTHNAFGIELRLVDKLVDTLIGRLDLVASEEVRTYLSAIKKDQGAIIQLTPEAMDLFQAGIADRKGVRYLSTASMAPPPGPARWLRAIKNPWVGVSSALFTTLHAITASYDEVYPCALREAAPAAEALLVARFPDSPGVRSNDGIVPLRSQIWGELAWVGLGDHLDVLGHFRGAPGGKHADWLTSGSEFSAREFDGLLDVVAGGILAST